MKQTLPFLFVLFSLINIGETKGQTKRFEYITAIEGLSYNTVVDITQDNNGFIWIATLEGLNRYDGYSIKVYYSDTTKRSIPSDGIHSLFVNSKGILYVGTSDGLCIYNPEFDNFTQIRYNNLSLGKVSDIFETSKNKILITSEAGVFYLSANNEIEARLPLEQHMGKIQEDSQGTFWTYRSQMLFHFDEKGNAMESYQVNRKGLPDFIPSSISSIKIDSKNRLWIGTFKDGPILMDLQNKKLTSIPLNSPYGKTNPMYYVRDIFEASDGKFWFGTEKGLFIYGSENKSYEHYLHSFDPTIASINDNAVYKVFESREKIIWLGTYFGGINFYVPFTTGFKTIKPGTKPGNLKGKALSQMLSDSLGNIWIATEDAGIAIYNKQNNTFKHILNNQLESNNEISSNVHALSFGQKGNIWTGSFLGGVNKISTQNYTIKNYSHIPGNPESLTHNFVFSLYTDSTNTLWVGTMIGLDIFDKKTEHFSRFKPQYLEQKFIYDIFQDNDGNFWFCTYNENGIVRYNKELDEITHFQKDSTEGISHNTFISHCVDSRGKIWFGTRGGGLIYFDPDTQKFTTYDMSDGFPNNVIYGILEDDHNNLWISSNKGISRFNYHTKEIHNFTVHHGLVGNQFNYKSYLKTDDGTMYFGAVNGLTYFHPDDIKTIESEPSVHFTNFKLFNEAVHPGEKSVLKNDIDQTKKITLKYKQNVISFDFIAVDFYSRGKNNFYYYMDGFESNWQAAGNIHSATYTNLPPGEYVFRIKATNLYNYPNEKERTIKLIILPPIWKTYWAYVIYFLLIGGIVFTLYRMNEIRHQEKMTLRIEKIEKEKLNEIHQHKINFFTYISHEFKTPLTILLATIESFFSDKNIPTGFNKRLITLKRNAMRLQFLINQLMDFRKVETDHAPPVMQSGDVIQFLNEIFNAFNTLFTMKNIEYIFVSECESLNIKFEADKLEKIVSNLLSNAFKYTPQNGEIKFTVGKILEGETSYLHFTVSDSGDGISKEKLNKIFNLFYKIKDNQNEYQGSGIGLTLTQSLVKFLNGSITVESEQGEGTKFDVKLPYTEELNRHDTNNNISFDRNIIDNLIVQALPKNGEEMKDEPNKEFDILFVEDDRELLKFLGSHFKQKYATRMVTNGLEALEKIKKHIPDLVVTDLMMPKIDGITLCKELKSSFDYNHIPIIMLTSRSEVETRLESLEVGADQYLEKPFLLSELELQIRNILIAKANLKKHFIQFGNIQADFPIKNREQQFIEKVTSIVLKHLDNTEFGISTITEEIGVGRTLLHTKLKQIMDLSTTEFINTIRLKEAQKILLEEPNLTIAEVAYKVGFNDPNYFSRTFKKFYNVSPVNFRTTGITKY